MKATLILTISSLFALAGCSAEAKVDPAAALAPAVIEKLAKADAVDGAVDKVVHKCAGCSLGMDGKAEFALQVQDYAMHFCKDACLARFKQDPAKEITALAVK